MFLYKITRPFARLSFRIYLKKLFFSFPENIPAGKPVMLAVNHPTPFMDPSILAAFLPQPLFSLTRGDLFARPLFRFLLEQYNMIPIYRFRDGYADLKQNAATFKYCYQAWGEGKTIVIFSEGNCIMEKRLRPIQKGTARLAFGAWEPYPDLDLYIVPVGVNHTYPDRFREEVMFEFGQPIRVRDYRELYDSHATRAVNQLTATLAEKMAELVIIIDRPEDEDLAEQLFQLYRNEQPERRFPIVDASNKRLHGEKRIAAVVNQLPDDEKKHLKTIASHYFNLLNTYRIDDNAVIDTSSGSILNLIVIIAGIVPYIIGFSGNLLPAVTAQYITRKFVKDIAFHSSILWLTGKFLFLTYYLILILLLVAFYDNKLAFIAVSLLSLSGYLSLIYKEFYLKWIKTRRFSRLSGADRQILMDLRASINTFLK